jgi:hypothetical protein
MYILGKLTGNRKGTQNITTPIGGNLLPSTDTTILVKIQQQIISKILRQHVSAVKSHHQAKAEQRSGTWVVCTLWDPIHTIYVPKRSSTLV